MSGTHSNDGCQREIHDNQFVNQIVEVLGQGVTVVSMEGRFEYVNPAYAAMVGRTTQELIGLRPQAVTHPDDWTKLAQALKQRQAGHTTTYETRLLRSDGSIVYAHITGSPRWQEGQVIGTFVIITDLTEQRQAEKALHESEERYRLLVHKIRDVVFQTDAAGCWTFLNQVWEEITGFAVADSLAQSVDGYVYPEDSERHRAEFAPLMEGRKTDCRYEMRLITQEGGIGGLKLMSAYFGMKQVKWWGRRVYSMI